MHRNVFQTGVNTLSKMIKHFLHNQKKREINKTKTDKFVYFVSYDFVQIALGWSPNAYQINYGDTYDVSISNGNINARSKKKKNLQGISC